MLAYKAIRRQKNIQMLTSNSYSCGGGSGTNGSTADRTQFCVICSILWQWNVSGDEWIQKQTITFMIEHSYDLSCSNSIDHC